MTMRWKATAQADSIRRAGAYRELLRREAALGGSVFGPVPSGHRREFFCLDEHTWLWHEEWRETDGRLHSVTTRYDIKSHGIVKSQNGREQTVTAEEALNLLQAARNYQRRIQSSLYARS